MISFKRPARIAVLSLGLSAFVASALVGSPLAAMAGTGTPAGTSIINQATSSYSDTANNNYTSTSNKVTTVVQNAPSLTLVNTNSLTTVPGGQLTDVFTLTNTGNGNASFLLSGGGQTGTDGTFATVAAYVLTFPVALTAPTSAGCTVLTTTSESCTSLSNANALLNNNPVASGGVLTVGTVYNVASTATAGTISAPQTIITNLTATATQTTAANAGTATNQTSTPASANETDNVVGDARIDMQKFSTQPQTGANVTNNIMYVINAANGGSVPARDIQSVKTLLGSPSAGILISDKIPAFNSVIGTVASASVSTTAANGFPATSTASIYYSSSSTGATGSWTLYSGSGAFPAGTTFIGVLVSGTPIAELATNGNSTSNGVVAAAKAAVTLTFYVTPPTGNGSANPNAYTNMSTAVLGGNQPNLNPDSAVTNPPQNVVGPNIPANTADSTTAIDSGTQGILYPTPVTPGASTSPNASNTVAANAVVTAAVLNGPFTFPGATGSYNGVAAVSNNNDYTAVSFTPAGFVPTNTSATSVVGNALGAAATVNIPNTIQNNGNSTDNLTVSITAPAGFGVQIFASSATGAPTGVSLAGSTSTNTVSYTFNNVPSGIATDTANQVNYVAVYTVPATATAFTTYDAVSTVTSGNAPTATNATHNDLVPGGPVALLKTVALDATTCVGGVAIPGCIITYNIAYSNNSQVASACPAVPPTAASIPSYQAGYYAKNVVITENGSAAPNTWGLTYTNSAGTFKNTTGLNAAATDTNASSTFTGNSTGSYLLTDLIGGSATYVLAPGCTGTLSFKVTVNTQ